jgi:hypothetical protein
VGEGEGEEKGEGEVGRRRGKTRRGKRGREKGGEDQGRKEEGGGRKEEGLTRNQTMVYKSILVLSLDHLVVPLLSEVSHNV